MRKIINNRKYDTETATEVGFWSNGLGYSDHKWCDETLYRKRNGEYFIFGRGGGSSKYAERVGNLWNTGKTIIPLTYDEAQEWAADHLTTDECEREFGGIFEDGTETVMTIRLPAYAADAIRREAARKGKNIGEVVATLVSYL